MILLAFVGSMILAAIAARYAYLKGLSDGYGFAKDPWNFNYRTAADILRDWDTGGKERMRE